MTTHMDFLQLPTLFSFLVFALLATYVVLKNRRERVNVCFGIGMGLLAAMEFGNFMALIQMDVPGTLSFGDRRTHTEKG